VAKKMDEQFESEIEQHFTELRTSALVEGVQEAYTRVVLHNAPDDGWDAQMFGFAVYKYIQRRLLNLSKDANLGFELRSAHPTFRLGVGPFTLASYGCGQSGTQNIQESFPNNENGAPALVDLNQFCLDLEMSASLARPRALVLAHMGNSANGLEALYLAVPAGKQDGRINEWSYTKLLFKLEGQQEGGTPPLLPTPAPIDPAPLTLKLPIEKIGVVNG
jgi:hypothetical protein